MSSVAQIVIHSSQFPENVRRDLILSLRSRRVNHKFHYDSIRQTQKWLALHQAFSPSRNDADCAATYDRAFAEAATRIESGTIRIVGLGCGGGQKDTRLLKLLKAKGARVGYTASDVSSAMVLVARATALEIIAPEDFAAFVCDLTTADDLADSLVTRQPSLITFFGMMPNFEPGEILPKLAAMLQPADWLLLSANLAPGLDYDAGVRSVLPQYDNALTADWLLTFLFDLGVERNDGTLRFGIEGRQLKRIVAHFHFTQPRTLRIEDETFSFAPGEMIRLFFSYRYTPTLAQEVLGGHGFSVVEQWITPSEEEGVFLCRKK